MKVRRSVAEKRILQGVRERLFDYEDVVEIHKQVESAVAELRKDLPAEIRAKQAELEATESRVANYVDWFGRGKGTPSLEAALSQDDRRAEELRHELSSVQMAREKVFRAPPIEWLKERLLTLQDVLEQRTEQSALLLRGILGPIRLEPVHPDIGRAYYRAVTAIDTVALVEMDPPPEGPGGNEGPGPAGSPSWQGPENGANSMCEVSVPVSQDGFGSYATS
ncbi:MAG: hypothetical protein WD834_05215, partial [Actinomycetota bacterium]